MRLLPTLTATALLLAAVSAQRPSFLMLRDPARAPVRGALGLVLTDPARELPALAELGGVELFFGHEPTVIGAGPSRDTGALQLGGGQGGAMRPGAVLVLADLPDGDHLAAFVPRLLPGEADKIALAPSGRIRGPDAKREITLLPAIVVEGRRIVLPALRGPIIPLPPGRYEVWVELDGQFTWQPLDVVAGGTITIAFDGPSRELQRIGDETVVPAGRADVVLLDDERARCVLRGRATTALLTAHLPGTGRVVTAAEPQVAPAPTDANVLELRPRFATPPAGTTHGFVVSRTAFDTWRVLGANGLGDDGVLRLPRDQSGDVWVLITAPDHAPFAVPMVEVDPERELTIAAGTALTANCRLEGGDPARDVLLEFVPKAGDVATVAARSDRRGRVDFGRVTMPGTVRTSDARYANIESVIDAVPPAGLRLTLSRGFEVGGVVRLPDGSGAGGVTVTLRAPHDALRPRQRSAVTDDDGSFTFGGLTEDHEYVLFATTRRLGRTWSSKVGRFVATAEPLVLTIRNEDPQLGPGR